MHPGANAHTVPVTTDGPSRHDAYMMAAGMKIAASDARLMAHELHLEGNYSAAAAMRTFAAETERKAKNMEDDS